MRATLMGCAVLVTLSATGCLTTKVIDEVRGKPPYDPSQQPMTVLRAEDGADGNLWVRVRYADLSERTLRVQPAARGVALAQFAARPRDAAGRAIPVVTAGGIRRGVWLEPNGRTLWRRDVRGAAAVARLPSLDDPLGKGHVPPTLAKRMVWASLLPFTVVIDAAIGVPALLLGS